jgi:hypothetical protein
MAKSARERIEADVAKAEREARKAKLDGDYKEWVGRAAASSISDKEKELFMLLAEETLKNLDLLREVDSTRRQSIASKLAK